MGQRGPQPGSGGRPKKPLADKVLEGNPGKRPLKLLDLPKLEGAEVPPPREYLAARQYGGKDLYVVEIYTDAWAWLKKHKCEAAVSAQVLERYAMSAARWIQCEEAISEFGFLAKHPTTGAPIQSPFVAMSQSFMKQTNSQWAQIYQVVREHCSTVFEERSPQDNVMEALLSARRNA